MTITIDQLIAREELGACADLQRAVLGDRARSVWFVSALTAVHLSGGLVLGARGSEVPPAGPLAGALVDLHANVDGYPARHTVFRGVHPSARHLGIAQALRATERRIHRESAVDLVLWSMDPLRSIEGHLAFNKLGAIATGYARNVYGEVHDHANTGLATDRLRVEWWIGSPRVESILDRGHQAPHYRLGIHEMGILTETRILKSGVRMLTPFNDTPRTEHVLVEIPADLDRIREIDPAAAREWRLQSRAAFELLFESGYVGTGFVHEGGRSFHLFRKADRGAALRDT